MAYKAILWLDLETTGSNRKDDFILELGMYPTTMELFPIDLGQNWVVKYDEAWEARLDLLPVVREMHEKNGLLEDCKRSTELVESIDALADAKMSEWSRIHGLNRHEWLLAGSGISHFDRDYVKRDFPSIERWLAYPNLDIGVMRRAFQYLGGEQFLIPAPESAGDSKTHRALDDAIAHCNEARDYKAMFRKMSEVNLTFVSPNHRLVTERFLVKVLEKYGNPRSDGVPGRRLEVMNEHDLHEVLTVGEDVTDVRVYRQFQPSGSAIWLESSVRHREE